MENWKGLLIASRTPWCCRKVVVWIDRGRRRVGVDGSKQGQAIASCTDQA